MNPDFPFKYVSHGGDNGSRRVAGIMHQCLDFGYSVFKTKFKNEIKVLYIYPHMKYL